MFCIKVISSSSSPLTLTVAVEFNPNKKSVETLKNVDSSTIYCVEGTEIPISHAFTLERVM